MTPQEIETSARRRYNSVGDSFWSQDEIMDLIYQACLDLAVDALVIEQVYTTSTVASQQEYLMPTNSLSIKRVTVNGNKLLPITMREDDALTLNNSTTTATGLPQYYWIWAETLYLRPIPDSIYTMKVFSINEPQSVSVTSTLEVPSFCHPFIIDFVVAEMCAKDSNLEAYQYYRGRWEEDKNKCHRWWNKRRRRDGFTSVQDEESLPTTILGTV